MEIGYIFLSEGGRGVDSLPVLITIGSWIGWNDSFYRVDEYVSSEVAGKWVDLDYYDDVDIWCLCVNEYNGGFDIKAIEREVKLNDLL